ncbi:MAG: thioredoxin family protein [Proteobacteria bacterium]|nr:thioredoxin family protein [Pseudomonadota bacterium]
MAAIVFVASAGLARAAQLVMFDRPGCPWCAAFDREVAPKYEKTEMARLAPLRRVDITRAIPRDLDAIVVERFTPVFVLVNAGREVGRIRGYPGEDHFWGLLSVLFEKLELRRNERVQARTDAAPRVSVR